MWSLSRASPSQISLPGDRTSSDRQPSHPYRSSASSCSFIICYTVLRVLRSLRNKGCVSNKLVKVVYPMSLFIHFILYFHLDPFYHSSRVCLISARLLQFHPSRATNDNAGTATASSPLRSATRPGPQALGPRDSRSSRSSLATNQAENRLQALPACPSCSYWSSTVLLVRAADGGGRCSRTCFRCVPQPATT